jgi:hypothetical protein
VLRRQRRPGRHGLRRNAIRRLPASVSIEPVTLTRVIDA